MLADSSLTAADVMTRTVVTVPPDASVPAVAKLLASHHISAVPVVDAGGVPIGIVSEGDLVTWPDQPSERQTWWLDMLGDGFTQAPEFLDFVRFGREKIKTVMKSPVIAVGETTPLHEIARLLVQHNIKRVVVVKNDKLAGIVSRADLIRAMAGLVPASR